MTTNATVERLVSDGGGVTTAVVGDVEMVTSVSTTGDGSSLCAVSTAATVRTTSPCSTFGTLMAPLEDW